MRQLSNEILVVNISFVCPEFHFIVTLFISFAMRIIIVATFFVYYQWIFMTNEFELQLIQHKNIYPKIVKAIYSWECEMVDKKRLIRQLLLQMHHDFNCFHRLRCSWTAFWLAFRANWCIQRRKLDSAH